jgi:hypothetical protein
MKGFEKPQPVDDATLAFPAMVAHLLPTWEEIPDEFKGQNEWTRLVDKWFGNGGQTLAAKTRDDITARDAIRHLQACLGSYGLKHEHKIAGVAYLMSLWFVKFEFRE